MHPWHACAADWHAHVLYNSLCCPLWALLLCVLGAGGACHRAGSHSALEAPGPLATCGHACPGGVCFGKSLLSDVSESGLSGMWSWVVGPAPAMFAWSSRQHLPAVSCATRRVRVNRAVAIKECLAWLCACAAVCMLQAVDSCTWACVGRHHPAFKATCYHVYRCTGTSLVPLPGLAWVGNDHCSHPVYHP
jgi:hypothetical protein